MGADIRETFVFWSRYCTISFYAPSIFTNNTTLSLALEFVDIFLFFFHLTLGLSQRIHSRYQYVNDNWHVIMSSQTNFPFDSDLLDHITYHSTFQITICSGFSSTLTSRRKDEISLCNKFVLTTSYISITLPIKCLQFPLTCRFNIFACIPESFQLFFEYFDI